MHNININNSFHVIIGHFRNTRNEHVCSGTKKNQYSWNGPFFRTNKSFQLNATYKAKPAYSLFA